MKYIFTKKTRQMAKILLQNILLNNHYGIDPTAFRVHSKGMGVICIK